MKSTITLLALGALLAAPALLSAKITRTVEKTFTVQPGGTLKVQTQGGDIKVLTGTGNEVKVTATQKIAADTDAKADELLKDLDLTIEQAGDNVTAISKYDRSGGWHIGNWPPVHVSFTVVVPARYNVNLNTSGGDISLQGINGQAKLRTSGGNLRLARVEGEVDGGTSGGDIILEEGTANVKLSTSGGNIHVDRAGGEAELNTSGGDIEINSVHNRLTASTSGGNVHANIEGLLKNDCKLTTSGGDVVVSVDKAAGFDLRARTSGGDVDAAGITIQIERGGLRKSSLAGKVNGGGPELYLASSGGDIRIRTN
ncbi:MAG: putative adhesin [Lacunisphaera sp.]|nr:putative adhesin [Lacunisphaera sp.]